LKLDAPPIGYEVRQDAATPPTWPYRYPWRRV